MPNSLELLLAVIAAAGLVWFFQWKLPPLLPFLRNMGLWGLVHQWKNPPSKGKQEETRKSDSQWPRDR
jgi:hypothetical protein